MQSFTASDEKDCSQVRRTRVFQLQTCQLHGRTSTDDPFTPGRLGFAGSQLPKGARKQAGQRVFARPGEQESKGQKEFGEREFHSAMADVVTVREMD